MNCKRYVYIIAAFLLSFMGVYSVFALLISPNPVSAAGQPWYVSLSGDDTNDCLSTNSPCLSIQRAVNMASDGDIIYIAEGNYSQSSITTGMYAMVDITKSLTIKGGYNISFTIWNPQSYSTILNAEQQGRVVYISGSVTSTIAGVVITGGHTLSQGAGIYVENASITIAHTLVYNNIVSGTGSAKQGGGIFLKNADHSQILSSTIVNNSAANGAGIYIQASANVQLQNLTISQNVASAAGGGLYFEGRGTLLNSHITANQADEGGGGYFYTGTYTVANTIMAHNQATQGSAVYLHSNTQFANNTLVNNVGDAAILSYGTLSQTVVLTNNIIVGHDLGILNLGQGQVYNSYTLFWDNITTTKSSSNHIHNAHNIACSPAFVNAASDDYRLLGTSCVLDKGGAIPWLTVDRHGNPRPSGLGKRFDIGAYEYYAVLAADTKLLHYPATPRISETVSFEVLALAGEPSLAYTYTLNFGDGSPTMLQTTPSFTHTYTNTGTYPLTLTVTSSYDHFTLTHSLTVVSTTAQVPVSGAEILYYPTAPITTGYIITLQAQVISGTGPISYTWLFDDSTIKTGGTISHAFTTDGFHTVNLSVTNTYFPSVYDVATQVITTYASGNGTYYVTPSGDDALECSLPYPCRSIQRGIDVAQTGDTVYIAGGDYSWSALVPTYTVGVHGLVDVTKTITVVGSGDSNEPTILDAEGQSRVVFVSGSITLTLKNVQITGGQVLTHGGGLYIQGATLILDGISVYSNTAAAGGGVYFEVASNSQVVNTTIFSNTANYGGGIYISATRNLALLNNTNLQYNHAITDGGGLYRTHTTTATIMSGISIIGNTADNNCGGGLYLEGPGTLERSIISDNRAKIGGGICIQRGLYTVTNSIMDNNKAVKGSGIYAKQDALLVNNTLFNNQGGAGILCNGGVTQTCWITNTIVVSHNVGISGTGSIYNDHAVLWNNTISTTGNITNTNVITDDPAFINPDNGNYHIPYTSSAYDAGVEIPWLNNDVDNQPRPSGKELLYDVGADEYYCTIPTVLVNMPPTPRAGDEVTFEAFTWGDPRVLSYTWDLDGKVESGRVVTEGYSAGTYTIVLTVTSYCNQEVFNTSITVVSFGTEVRVAGAGFFYTPSQSLSTNQTITFTGYVTKGTEPITYDWLFDDGITATGRIITHSFTVPGKRQVVMKATNTEYGVPYTVQSTRAVIICQPVYAPGFLVHPPTPTRGQAATLAGWASGSLPYTLTWQPDSSNNDLLTGPTTNYVYPTNGNVTAILTISNQCQQIITTSTFSISDVGITMPPSGANFVTNPAILYVGETITFTGYGERGTGPMAYMWDFEDGDPPVLAPSYTYTHQYNQPGHYTVTLTLSNSTPLTDSVSVPITVVYRIELGKSAPVTVTLNNPITYTLSITNHTDYARFGIVLTDTLDWRTSHLSGCTPMGGRVVSCTLDMLPINSSHTFTIVAQANSGGMAINGDYRVSDAEGVSTSGYITVETFVIVPIDAVTITGPISGAINQSYNFRADIIPLGATQPITYVGEASGSVTPTIVTNTNGTNDTQAFTWPALGTETVTVTAYNMFNTVSATHMITIVPTANFTPAHFSMTEVAGFLNIAVQINTPTLVTGTVDYNLIGGNATSGDDFGFSPGTLTFIPGVAVPQYVVVEIRDDGYAECNETIIIQLNNPQNLVIGGSDTVTITIRDNEARPKISFSTGTYSATEDTSPVLIPVTLSASMYGCNSYITCHTQDGTATNREDYTATTMLLTFAPTSTTEFCEVLLINDNFDELITETVILSLTNPLNAQLGAFPTATVIITDDDVVMADFFMDTFTVTEGSGPALITVTLDITATQQVTVACTTGNGTAVAGHDYISQTAVLTYAPGESVLTFSVPIIDDNFAELNEMVLLTLTSVSDNAERGILYTTTLIIIDNEPPVVVTPTNLIVSEPDGSDNFTITLTSKSTTTVTVTLSTSNHQCSVVPPTITLTNGNWLTGDIATVTAVNDNINDGDQICIVQTSAAHSADAGYDNLEVDDVAVVVKDDDESRLSIHPLTVTVSEDGITGTWGISLTSEPTKSVTVDLIYDSQQITLTPSVAVIITPSEWSQTRNIVVEAIDDTIEEETLVTLITYTVHSDDTQYEGITETVVVTITDNDTATLNVLDATIIEGDAITKTARFSVTLDPTSTEWVTISYTTKDITAYAGDDYISHTGVLTFAPKQYIGVIYVPVRGDWLDEITETFEVNLYNPINAQIDDGQGIGEIIDNDTAGIDLNRSSLSVSESGAKGSFEVWLNSQPTATVDIVFGTDKQLQPIEPVSFTAISWDQARIITVTAIDDDFSEFSPHTSTVKLLASTPDGQYENKSENILIYITDDDHLPLVAFYNSVYRVAEDTGMITIPVTLTAPLTVTVWIDYMVAGRTANSKDYIATNGTLTFAPGSLQQSFSIAIVDDTLPEKPEDIILSLGNPRPLDYVQMGQQSWTTLWILDNDQPQGGIEPLQTITITGRTDGVFSRNSEAINPIYTFVATVAPRINTSPITFTWQITEPIVRPNCGISDNFSLRADPAYLGLTTITVTAANQVNNVVTTVHTIQFTENIPPIMMTDCDLLPDSVTQPITLETKIPYTTCYDDPDNSPAGPLADIQWIRDDKPQSRLNDKEQVPLYMLVNGEKVPQIFEGERWCVRITPSDGLDYGSTFSDCVTIGELYTLPQAIEVAIMLTQPSTTTSLSVVYTPTKQNNESRRQVRWYRKGVLQSQYRDDIEITPDTRIGETWCVTVRLYDNEHSMYGPVSELGCKVIALQAPPVISKDDCEITPDPTNNDLILDCSPALRPTDEIRWYRDNVFQPGLTTVTVDTFYTLPGERWYATVRPIDDDGNEGIVVVDILSVFITQPGTNLPPDGWQVRIAPAYPSPASPLRLHYSYWDVDKDLEGNTQVRWYIVDTKSDKLKLVHQPQFDNLTVIPTNVLKLNDMWFARVWLHDKKVYNQSYLSAPPVTIGSVLGNTLPEAHNPYITPEYPKPEHDLYLRYSYYDLEGDPEAATAITWTMTPPGGASDTFTTNVTFIPSKDVQSGQIWCAEITPNDGQDNGRTVKTKCVTIRTDDPGSYPEVTSAYLVPQHPASNQAIRLVYNYFHPSGIREGQTEIRWYKNGEPAGDKFNAVTVIPADETEPGDRWFAQITPCPQKGECYSLTTTPIIIVNRPPIVSGNLVLTPSLGTFLSMPRGDERVQVNYDMKKVDTIPVAQVAIRWYRDGNYMSQYDDLEILPDTATRMGGAWQARVMANDGVEITVFTSTQVTINRPPEAQNVYIMPLIPREGDSLIVEHVPVDFEQDTTMATQYWTRNDVYLPMFTGQQVISPNLVLRSDTWCAYVRLHDGNIYGQYKRSNCVTILPSDSSSLGNNQGTILDTQSDVPLIYNAHIIPYHQHNNRGLAMMYMTNPVLNAPVHIHWSLNGIEQSDLIDSLTIYPERIAKNDVWCASLSISGTDSIQTNCLTPASISDFGKSSIPEYNSRQQAESCFDTLPNKVRITPEDPQIGYPLELEADPRPPSKECGETVQWFKNGQVRPELKDQLELFLDYNAEWVFPEPGDQISVTVSKEDGRSIPSSPITIAADPLKGMDVQIRPVYPFPGQGLRRVLTPTITATIETSETDWFKDSAILSEYHNSPVMTGATESGEKWKVQVSINDNPRDFLEDEVIVVSPYGIYLPYIAANYEGHDPPPCWVWWVYGIHENDEAQYACAIQSGTHSEISRPDNTHDDWYAFFISPTASITLTLTDYHGEGSLVLHRSEDPFLETYWGEELRLAYEGHDDSGDNPANDRRQVVPMAETPNGPKFFEPGWYYIQITNKVSSTIPFALSLEVAYSQQTSSRDNPTSSATLPQSIWITPKNPQIGYLLSIEGHPRLPSKEYGETVHWFKNGQVRPELTDQLELRLDYNVEWGHPEPGNQINVTVFKENDHKLTRNAGVAAITLKIKSHNQIFRRNSR